jgi:hypothetical protein
MQMYSITGTILTLAAAMLSLIFGVIYLTRPRYLPYHRSALGKEWEELEPEMRTLILALMRAVGGGSMAAGFGIAFLQFQFNREQESWIALCILIMGLLLAFGSLYAMFLVRFRTKGRPPVWIVSILLVMMIAGYFFNVYG